MNQTVDDHGKADLAALDRIRAAIEAETIVRISGLAARRAVLEQVRTHRSAVPYVVAQTFWGGTLIVEVGEVVSEHLFMHGMFEPGLTEFFVRWLRPGDTAIDVGGHIGYFTALAAHAVGPSGAVHVLEPSSETARLLIRNVRWLPQVRHHAVAAWSACGEMEMTEFERRFAAFNTLVDARLPAAAQATARSWRRLVPTVTLDELTAEHGLTPALVKIDAEGAEREIVRGMERVLTELRPAVTLEVGDTGDLKSTAAGPNRDMINIVLEHGYTALEWSDGAFRRHRVRPEWTYPYDNVICVPTESIVDAGGVAQCRGGALAVHPFPDLFRGDRLALGPEPQPDIVTTGFFAFEWHKGKPCRWTGERLQIWVPLSGNRVPTLIEIELWAFGPPDRTVRIRANDVVLFDGPHSVLTQRTELPLESVPALGDALKIEIVCAPFRPPTDPRSLGVCVRDIALVAAAR